MLVLTRKIGEKIVIAGDITVTIVSIEGGKIRVGVQAPKSVSIDRAEIHQRKQEELADCQPKRELALA